MDFLTPTLPYIKFLQQFPFLLRPMQFFSLLGTEICYLALLPVIYWAVSRPLGARLGALLLFSAIVNEIFKVGFALPRPYWVEPALMLGTDKSFGFPSGHAQNAWLIWPFLALQAQNRRLWVPLSLILAFLITISRNFLGVHFLVDSIGGTVIGLTILLLARKGGPAWMRFWHQLSTLQKSFFIVLASLFLAGIYAVAMFRGVYPTINGYGAAMMPEYQLAVQNAIKGGQIASRLGGFCGLLIGVALLARFSDFEAQVPLRILLPRLIVGFVGLAAFYVGLRYALPNGLIWSFINYFATTFWIAFAAPLAFEKLFKTEKRRVV